jgi:tripartite-type tricarboxylate transporter receptor subunit TctC
VVTKINKEVTRIFSDPAFRQRFLDPQMFESMTGPPNDFAAFVKAERAKWAKLIAEVGIKIE